MTGAMGGPCSGHLLVSHVPLMVESAVGQLNSLPLLSQTGAKFPGQQDIFFYKKMQKLKVKEKRGILPW